MNNNGESKNTYLAPSVEIVSFSDSKIATKLDTLTIISTPYDDFGPNAFDDDNMSA